MIKVELYSQYPLRSFQLRQIRSNLMLSPNESTVTENGVDKSLEVSTKHDNITSMENTLNISVTEVWPLHSKKRLRCGIKIIQALEQEASRAKSECIKVDGNH